MAKRARRAAARDRDDVVTPQRRRHGPVERLVSQIADVAGAIGRPYRAVDTLAVMERRGTITAEMRQAGENFRHHFNTAHLDPLHAASLLRTAPGRRDDGPGQRIEAARHQVWRAVCAVGGLASPGGACLWHCVGLEETLKQWALESGWSGRRISQESASGVLVAALGTLTSYYEGRNRRDD